MEVVTAFEHGGKSYGLLAEVMDEAFVEDEPEEGSLYIFEMAEGPEGVEYLAIEDDDMLTKLSELVEQMVLLEEES